MRAGELRAILEHLPDDVEIVIRGAIDPRHIGHVKRETANKGGRGWKPFVVLEPVREFWRDTPSSPQGVNWQHDEPSFTLAGPFRHASRLEERLGDR